MGERVTHRLARADCNLHFTQRRSRIWIAVVLAAVSLSAYAMMHKPEQGETRAELVKSVFTLRGENATLRAEAEKSRLDARLEAATRASLEKQLGEMSAQLKRLQDEITFLRSQREKVREQQLQPQ